MSTQAWGHGGGARQAGPPVVEGPPQLQGSVAWQEPEAGGVGAKPGAAAKQGAEPDPPAYGSTGLWPDMMGGGSGSPESQQPVN